MPDLRQAVKLAVDGAVATSSRDRWIAAFPGDVTNVMAVIGTAPVGADMILDVQKNGVTIFTTTANRPKILDGATKTAARSATPDVTSFAAGDVISLVPTQIGSGTAGSDLDVVVEYVGK